MTITSTSSAEAGRNVWSKLRILAVFFLSKLLNVPARRSAEAKLVSVAEAMELATNTLTTYRNISRLQLAFCFEQEVQQKRNNFNV